jgi:hypothetical protein
VLPSIPRVLPNDANPPRASRKGDGSALPPFVGPALDSGAALDGYRLLTLAAVVAAAAIGSDAPVDDQ